MRKSQRGQGYSELQHLGSSCDRLHRGLGGGGGEVQAAQLLGFLGTLSERRVRDQDQNKDILKTLV